MIFCECPVRRPIFCEDALCECPPPRSSPCPDDDPALYGAAAVAQQVLGSRRRRRALGRARGRARPNTAGCGEVTSPLFSITSILNTTSYHPQTSPRIHAFESVQASIGR